MKRIILILPLLTLFSTALIFAENVSADDSVTDTTTFQVSITEFLTLTVDQTDNIAHLSPNTRFNTGSVVASVATNNAAGYTLTLEDEDDRNGLERAGYSSASVADKPLYNIPSVVSATTYANLTDDTYGYFLGSTTATEATYLPVPLTSTEIASSDGPTAPAESTTVNFGVKIAATRPSGAYEDTIVISAVANPLPLDPCVPSATTVSEAVCMQDMNSSVINSMVTGTQYQLRDNRDDKMYWIAKLADGKVWMTQNLDLDLEAVPANVAPLTHANTDLGWTDNNPSATWTPKNSTVSFDSSSSSDISGWVDDSDDPYSADPGTQYVLTSGSVNNDIVYYTLADCVAGSPSNTEEKCSHYYTGNYYNWTAATANNDTSSYTTRIAAPNSICPAGWQLPRSLTADTKTEAVASDYNKLMVAQGIMNDWLQTEESISYDLSTFISIRQEPLFMVSDGTVYSDGPYLLGSEGGYWSGSSFDDSEAYQFIFNSTGLRTDYDRERGAGIPIRCVAR